MRLVPSADYSCPPTSHTRLRISRPDDSAVVSGAVIDVEQFPLGGLEPW